MFNPVQWASRIGLVIFVGSCLLSWLPSWAHPVDAAQTVMLASPIGSGPDQQVTECGDSDGDGECDVSPPSE